MNFAQQHRVQESTASLSGIRYVPPPVDTAEAQIQSHNVTVDSNGNHNDTNRNELQDADSLSLLAANKAAANHFGLTDETLVDATMFKERSIPNHSLITPGDLVVVMESFDNLDFVYAKHGDVYSNRNGNFHHDDFIGLPFGAKLRSRNNRGYGFVYLLRPTPELWTRSLNHRTQIIQELDQAQIICNLDIRPNAIVAESGTGSGALSHALIRSVAPYGHLHTYEFNEARAKQARIEFTQHGFCDDAADKHQLVTVRHTDVCRQGFVGLEPQSVNAVILDLPEPWLAVPHAARVLCATARIASYSPCIEQVQKTCEALKKHGFHSLKTMEYRLQEYYVDKVEYKGPSREKRVKLDPHLRIPEHNRDQFDEKGARRFAPIDRNDNDGTAANKSGNNDNEAFAKRDDSDVVTIATKSNAESQTIDNDPESEKNANDTEKIMMSDNDIPQQSEERKRKHCLVSRPFSLMRGHTAFLTFATMGNHCIAGQAIPGLQDQQVVGKEQDTSDMNGL